jgi:hypothetical protein
MSEDPFADLDWAPVPKSNFHGGERMAATARICRQGKRLFLVVSVRPEVGFPARGQTVRLDLARAPGDLLAVRVTPDPKAHRRVYKTGSKANYLSVQISAWSGVSLGAPGSLKGVEAHPRDDGVVIVTFPLNEVTRTDREGRAANPFAAVKAPAEEGSQALRQSANPVRELAPRKVRRRPDGKWEIEGEIYTAHAVILTLNNHRRRKGLPLLADNAELVGA